MIGDHQANRGEARGGAHTRPIGNLDMDNENGP